jgi:hypothetical protein
MHSTTSIFDCLPRLQRLMSLTQFMKGGFPQVHLVRPASGFGREALVAGAGCNRTYSATLLEERLKGDPIEAKSNRASA